MFFFGTVGFVINSYISLRYFLCDFKNSRHNRTSCWDSLRSVGHAEGRQVSIGEGEQGHDDDEGKVVTEQDEFGVLHVTHHEQRDEDQAGHHGRREQKALLRRLHNANRVIYEWWLKIWNSKSLEKAADLPIGRETGWHGRPSPRRWKR